MRRGPHPSIEWTDEHGKHAADFAFWSVVGAQGGASVTTDQSLDVTVGSSEMQAAAWYLPAGGNGNGGPAFYIDAFDVNEGRFFNEDFVTVSPDASLAANANETGVVPTESAEEITAVESIEGVPFLDWTEFVQPAPEVLTGEELRAEADTTAVAFAFYQTPASAEPHRPSQSEIATWVSWGVKVDGGGPTGARTRGTVEPVRPPARGRPGTRRRGRAGGAGAEGSRERAGRQAGHARLAPDRGADRGRLLRAGIAATAALSDR